MYAIIDRFEGSYAVLLIEEQDTQFDLPKKLLPASAKEGDVVTLTIEVNGEETEGRRKESANLLEKMNTSNKI